MFGVGMLGSYLTQGVYAVAGPFQPFGGAVDIIVVEQKDGSFKSSPWYVKFGDFQGAFKSREKVVNISVNDAPAGFHMSLDINGDAYFEKEIETQDTEEGSVRPSCSSSSSSDVISLEGSIRSEDVLIGQSSCSQALNGLEPNLSHDGRLNVEIEDVQKEASFGAHHDSADVGAENSSLNGHVEYCNGSDYGLSYDSRITSETQETHVSSNVIDICFSGDSASIVEPQGANDAAESVIEITEPHQDAELKINLLCNTCYENSINNLTEKSAESLSDFRTEATNVVGGDSTELVNGGMIQNGEHDTVLVELGTQILELEFTLQSAQAETDISSYSFEQLMHDERETSSVENPHLDECKSSQKLRNGFDTETEVSQGNAKDSNLLSHQKVEEPVVEINESEKPGEKEERKEKEEKVVVSRMPSSSKWNFWSLSFRGSRTEKGTSDHTLLTTSSLRTPTEGLLKENSYYKWSKKTKIRTYVPTSAQLASLKLNDGPNKVTFVFTSVLGKTEVDARIYLWKWNTRIVISDVDGTITKSDVLGHVMPLVGRDWSQDGVTRLFSAIKDNGFEVLFLSARAITQAYLTRKFLLNLKQNGETLPEGPIFISPDGLLPSLYREVIRRAPHEFKISCLKAIRELFPKDVNPFYAGFGNRITDEISYLKVGIPKGKIFIINPKGEVVVDNHVDRKSYTSLHALVNDMFPPMSSHEQEEFNSWNYWKVPYPDIEDEINAEKSKNSKKGRK